MSLRSELKEFILRNYLLTRDGTLLGDSESLTERGILDSTGALELVMHLEQRYGIKIQDDELHPDNLDSVEKIAAFVQRKGLNSAMTGAGQPEES